MTTNHAMRYRAGTHGLGFAGLADAEPHWYCECGRWKFAAKPMPRAKTGNNLKAAERSWTAHCGAVFQ